MDTNVKYIFDYIASICGSEYGAAGLLGNIQAESGIIPYRKQGDFSSGYTKSIEYTNKVDNGTISKYEFVHDSIGYGLAQWTFSTRKEKYYDHVKNRGGSIGSTENGVSYLVSELQNDYPGVWNVMQTSNDIKSISDKVLHDFENPKEQGVNVENYRYQLSLAIYNEYSGGIIPPTPPTPPPTPPTPHSNYSRLLPYIIGSDED